MDVGQSCFRKGKAGLCPTTHYEAHPTKLHPKKECVDIEFPEAGAWAKQFPDSVGYLLDFSINFAN